MKFRAIWIAAITMAGLTGLVDRSLAQVTTAAIHGTVADTSGAVLADADITVLNTSTGISATAKSDNSGYYTVTQLQAGGPYTVTISANGFAKSVTKGIQLNVNDNREVNAKLAVGTEAQTVEVQAGAVQVETTETQLKIDISASEITQMPLLGRDATILEKTTPGIVESADRLGGFAANGSQTGQNSYLLDGSDVNDSALQDEGIVVNPDATGEVAIVTSTLNPEYSRNSGAIINQTLKTGTNTFHGNGFDFYRDTFLNTPNYFSLGQKTPIHQNVYGGTLGGPVFKSKFFFFLAYQGVRGSAGFTQNTPVFSPDQRSGNFSADGAAFSANPMPFALEGCPAGTPWNACKAIQNRIIPQSSWNPIALKLFQQFVPPANVTSPGSNGQTSYLYNFNNNTFGNDDQGIIRLDYHPTQKDALWASTVFESHPTGEDLPFGGSTLPGFAQVNAAHFKVFDADYTRIFNSNTINDLRAGYYRFNYAAVEPATVVAPSSFGFAISPQSPSENLPVMQIKGYFDLGFSFEGPQPRKDSNLLAQDVFTRIIGNHSLKFGGTFEQFGVDNPYYADNDGIYTYTGNGSFSSGDPAIDFLLGVPTTYSQDSGGLVAAISREYYAFAQDSWKATPDFTVNYGLSWDAETPWANHQFGGVAINCFQASSATSRVFPGGPPGLLYPGDPGCTTYGAATVKWDHFGPRVGFAWSPSSGPARLIGNHDLAVRAGFGMYFNRDLEEEALQNLSAPPFLYGSRGAADVGGSPSFANPFADVAARPANTETNPFPYQRPARGAQLNWPNYAELELSTPSSQYTPPYAYNFNLNVQRSLPSKMVFQVGYVGSIGRKLARVFEGDPITPAGHAACQANPACNNPGSAAVIHLAFPQYTLQPAIVPGSTALTPNGIPWYASSAEQGSTGASSYHSLQVSLQKQVSHGLYFTLAYTYSHSLDDYSGYESSYGNGTPNGLNSLNGRAINFTPGFEYLNYGDSDYDARHRFVALYNYEIPILARMKDHFLLEEALGRWHISGTTALQTGFPVSIQDFGAYSSEWCDAFSYYGCADNPNTSSFHVKMLDPRGASHQWFDTSSFSPEPLGTFGNVGRNFFHGPGYNYTDLELYKDFPITREGSRYIELRLESYNVFNHTNFAEPDGNFSDGPFFGTIESVIQPGNFGVSAGDPQPGRTTQLAGKFYF